MPAAVLQFPRATAPAQYCVISVCEPGWLPVAIGVFLYDAARDRVQMRLREEFRDLGLEREDEEYLESLQQDFTHQIRNRGAANFLGDLESSLSNFLLISDREPAGANSLESLFEEHVVGRGSSVPVRPFITHLPLYTLQAAATKFGEDAEIDQAGYIYVPATRLSEGMFVARVVGQSMEPLIPDGSLCIFRAPVVGSRQGKRLLIEQFGAMETSARYTVKKYTSLKRYQGQDGEWEHASIRLEPLNPQFPAFNLEDGTFRVIAEFVRVLD